MNNIDALTLQICDLMGELEHVLDMLEDNADPEDIMDELHGQSGTIATMIQDFEEE